MWPYHLPILPFSADQVPTQIHIGPEPLPKGEAVCAAVLGCRELVLPQNIISSFEYVSRLSTVLPEKIIQTDCPNIYSISKAMTCCSTILLLILSSRKESNSPNKLCKSLFYTCLSKEVKNINCKISPMLPLSFSFLWCKGHHSCCPLVSPYLQFWCSRYYYCKRCEHLEIHALLYKFASKMINKGRELRQGKKK